MRSVSLIIRARDEAASIGNCLRLVRGQEPGGESVEVIVVDSGSRDATINVARQHAARILGMPAAEFTFGRALNLGAAEARGEILVALSAHAFLPDRGWLSRLLAAFDDDRVACASGERYRPDGRHLEAPVSQDEGLARRHPSWGYSNAAGGFRAELWRQRPFREDLPGCEDKEWARYWLERGYACRLDPALEVDHDHTHDPVRSIYVRARREAEGLAMGLAVPPIRSGELVGQWWSDTRFYDSPLRARLSHRRAARLLGDYVGRRRGAREAAREAAREGRRGR